MDYRKGEAIVTLRQGLVANKTTKLMVYVKGMTTIDFINSAGSPVVEMKEITNIPGMTRITIPWSNIAGINWIKLSEGHT